MQDKIPDEQKIKWIEASLKGVQSLFDVLDVATIPTQMAEKCAFAKSYLYHLRYTIEKEQKLAEKEEEQDGYKNENGN